MKGTERLWKQVFGEEGFWDLFFQTVCDPGHCLRIEEDGRVQAALYWFDCDCGGPWAYIFAVATHPDFRGRGLCRKLMEKTHAHLSALGYDGALLVPAEPGLRRMYAGMGYREATAIDQFPAAAGPEALPLKRLDRQSYAALRRAFLDSGGVRQGGDVFVLLEAMGVRFYAGEGCLLAAEGNAVLEYLGDREALPGVLAALGCDRATVRTPGDSEPFAMAIPLRKDVQLPRYFSFAFD